jgi:hypothetical protein
MGPYPSGPVLSPRGIVYLLCLCFIHVRDDADARMADIPFDIVTHHHTPDKYPALYVLRCLSRAARSVCTNGDLFLPDSCGSFSGVSKHLQHSDEPD